MDKNLETLEKMILERVRKEDKERSIRMEEAKKEKEEIKGEKIRKEMRK